MLEGIVSVNAQSISSTVTVKLKEDLYKFIPSGMCCVILVYLHEFQDKCEKQWQFKSPSSEKIKKMCYVYTNLFREGMYCYMYSVLMCSFFIMVMAKLFLGHFLAHLYFLFTQSRIAGIPEKMHKELHCHLL